MNADYLLLHVVRWNSRAPSVFWAKQCTICEFRHFTLHTPLLLLFWITVMKCVFCCCIVLIISNNFLKKSIYSKSIISFILLINLILLIMMKVYNCITVNRWVKRIGFSVFRLFIGSGSTGGFIMKWKSSQFHHLIQIHEQLKLHLIMFPIKPCL